jgi:hypothetical protein
MSPPATNSATAPAAIPVVGAIPPVAVSAVGVAVAVGLAVAAEVAVALALVVALAVPLAVPLAVALADISEQTPSGSNAL